MYSRSRSLPLVVVVHTALECYSGANREWPNWEICCHSDLMIGGSYMPRNTLIDICYTWSIVKPDLLDFLLLKLA